MQRAKFHRHLYRTRGQLWVQHGDACAEVRRRRDSAGIKSHSTPAFGSETGETPRVRAGLWRVLWSDRETEETFASRPGQSDNLPVAPSRRSFVTTSQLKASCPHGLVIPYTLLPPTSSSLPQRRDKSINETVRRTPHLAKSPREEKETVTFGMKIRCGRRGQRYTGRERVSVGKEKMVEWLPEIYRWSKPRERKGTCWNSNETLPTSRGGKKKKNIKQRYSFFVPLTHT